VMPILSAPVTGNGTAVARRRMTVPVYRTGNACRRLRRPERVGRFATLKGNLEVRVALEVATLERAAVYPQVVTRLPTQAFQRPVQRLGGSVSSGSPGVYHGGGDVPGGVADGLARRQTVPEDVSGLQSSAHRNGWADRWPGRCTPGRCPHRRGVLVQGSTSTLGARTSAPSGTRTLEHRHDAEHDEARPPDVPAASGQTHEFDLPCR